MELTIINWINEYLHGSYLINAVFKYISYLGKFWLVLGVVFLFFHNTRRLGATLIIAIMASIIVAHFILKSIIQVPRPFENNLSVLYFFSEYGIEPPHSSSFPSVHTAVSFSSAVILASFFKHGKWAYLVAGLIALSRVFLCVHYPSDILGGAFIGIIIGLFTFYLTDICVTYIKNNKQLNK